MIGNRPSTLNVTRYCSLAGRLGAEHGAGVEALWSSIFHATCAGKADEVRDKWNALTSEEQKELLTWKRPSDVQVPSGPLLEYSKAETEVSLAVLPDWTPTHWGDPRALCEGTLDFRWVETVDGRRRVAFVGDIKKQQFTCPEGTDSLQVLAYCLMTVSELDVDGYVPGIWFAEEGDWLWADQVTWVDSREFTLDLRTVEAAIKNTAGDPVTGSHCARCYERTHCPEYMAPVKYGALSPALNQQLTRGNALPVYNEIQRMKTQLKLAEDNLKAAMVNDGLRFLNEAGDKEYVLVRQKGRASFQLEKLKRDHGEDFVQKYIERGAETRTRKWIKTK